MVPRVPARSPIPPPEPSCTKVDNKDLRVAGSRVQDGTATLVVPQGACPVEVSFSSYDLPHCKIRPFEDQRLRDNVTGTYGPGTHTITVDIPANCWQSDLYTGPVLPHLIPKVGHPGDRLIRWDLDNSPAQPTANCRQINNQDLKQAGTNIQGGLATIVVPQDACPLEVSVSSYELYRCSTRPYDKQVLFDSFTRVYGPGTHTVAVETPATCWQSDIYTGGEIAHLLPNVGHPVQRIRGVRQRHHTLNRLRPTPRPRRAARYRAARRAAFLAPCLRLRPSLRHT